VLGRSGIVGDRPACLDQPSPAYPPDFILKKSERVPATCTYIILSCHQNPDSRIRCDNQSHCQSVPATALTSRSKTDELRSVGHETWRHLFDELGADDVLELQFCTLVMFPRKLSQADPPLISLHAGRVPLTAPDLDAAIVDHETVGELLVIAVVECPSVPTAMSDSTELQTMTMTPHR
jgi:hypothetical protein